jgi:hypothetical protein
MAKRKKRYRGISSTKEGNLYFTIHSLGNGNFHLNIGKLGQIYLFDGLNLNIGRSWNDDDVLKALFEIIDTKVFSGEFKDNFYSSIRKNDNDDIPF